MSVRDILQLANELSGEFVQEGDITERTEEVRVDGRRKPSRASASGSSIESK